MIFNLTSNTPINIKKNTSVSVQKRRINPPKLTRFPETDIFERMPQSAKKKGTPLNNFINRIVSAKQVKIPKTEPSGNVSIPGVFDFRNTQDGTQLPKNQPVIVNKNAVLLLAGVAEIDLGSEYLAPFINDMKNGQSFTIGRKGNIKISDGNNVVSGIHVEISKQQNQIVVKDMSLNGTQVLSGKINNNEFIRNVDNNGKPIDDNYLKTSKEVRYCLNKAINTGEYTQSFEDYKNLICKAHSIAYCGYSGNEYWYKKNNQIIKIEPYNIRYKDGLLKSSYGEHAFEVENIAKKYGDPYRASNKNVTTVKLKNISSAAMPINSSYTHIYPSGIYMDEYFKNMYETSKQAIQLIHNNAPQKMILDKIAEHYQYAVNARPFERINNSLFMNEANTLLKKAGMSAIPHGILDHVAQRLQPETFKKYFKDYYINNKLS